MTDRRELLDEFYGLLDELERRCGGRRTLATCSSRSGWPQRGVYFFFEPGQMRADGRGSRVVRVGTHGLTPSASTLWKRLAQHRGAASGSMPGGGNHRGSVFRMHVGNALLASGDWPPGLHETWPVRGSAPREVRQAEYELEKAVSAYIGAMELLWVGVDDPPSPESERGIIEVGAISLLSNAGRPAIDPPTPDWLGYRADRAAISESGLWNVNHVNERTDGAFLERLERWVRGS